MARNFSLPNLNNFKRSLSMLDWAPVTDKNDVNIAYEEFWNLYNTTFNDCFPFTRTKFNKNIHKKNEFMTNGLLISRRTKLNLQKASIVNPTAHNVQLYKNYRKIFQKMLNAAKKLHINEKLRNCKNNPHATWKILNDVIGKTPNNPKIANIIVNDTNLTSDLDIANAFNDFFVRIGKEISDSVPPTTVNFENYMPPMHNATPMNLQNTTPAHIISIAKSMAAKNSADFDGVTAKMVKLVINEISYPLSHILT
jgi:hypothetical protein